MLESAREAFLAMGFKGATVKAIARDAGVDQAMVYRFFKSKERLFEEAIAAPLQEAVGHLREMSLIPTEAEAEADYDVREHSVDATRDLLAAMREIAPLLNVVLTTDREMGTRFYRERFEPSMDQVRDVLLSNTALFEHNDFDPDLVIRVFVGTTWLLALDERFGTREPGDRDSAADLVGLVLDGLIARAEDA